MIQYCSWWNTLKDMVHSASTQPTGDGVNATWNYTLGSIVFICVAIDAILVMQFVDIVAASGEVVNVLLLLCVCVSVIVQIRFCWFLRAGIGGGLPHTKWVVALLAPAVLSWALAFITPNYHLLAVLPVWLAVSTMVGLLPASTRWKILLGTSVVAATPVFTHQLLGHSIPDDLWDVPTRMIFVYAISLPFMVIASLWWWGVVLRLDESRQVSAELAVAEERLRFAADLHDIQGHHLQVIALKSELAERLLAQHPAQAAEHIHEVRTIAKEAMEETRALVAGLRSVGLATELENAADVLAISGASCDLDIGELPTDARSHRVLALAVREATTNILRHSTATEISITLHNTNEWCTLAITNNGLTSPSDSTLLADGSGLAGLHSRISPLGGTLTTHTLREVDQYEMRVTIPTYAGVSA